MRIKEKEPKEKNLDLYVIDTFVEQTSYDVIHQFAVDEQTFKKYFPNWNYKKRFKPKLQPKRKKV